MADLFGNPEPETSVETKWCPADWLDEVVPCLVSDPADCVYPGGPTGWLMLDDEANRDEEPHFCRLPLEPGQIVGFSAHRNYGTFDLIIDEDGTFSIDPPYPADATYFALEDAFEEDMFGSPEELVKQGDPKSGYTTPLEAGTHQISIWHWSDEIPFRFELEDGRPKFVRCAGVL